MEGKILDISNNCSLKEWLKYIHTYVLKGKLEIYIPQHYLHFHAANADQIFSFEKITKEKIDVVIIKFYSELIFSYPNADNRKIMKKILISGLGFYCTNHWDLTPRHNGFFEIDINKLDVSFEINAETGEKLKPLAEHMVICSWSDIEKKTYK